MDISKIETEEAFERIFRNYYPRLYSYVSSMIADRTIADDIVQDVFLYIWENRENIHVGTGFQSYLFQTSYSRCIDYLRQQRPHVDYSSVFHMNINEAHEAFAQQNRNALDELYSQEFNDLLLDLLDKIPEQRKEVFLLSYIEGLKAREIAEKLDMPKRTVESHLYLAMKFLKGKINKKDFYIMLFGIISLELLG